MADFTFEAAAFPPPPTSAVVASLATGLAELEGGPAPFVALANSLSAGGLTEVEFAHADALLQKNRAFALLRYRCVPKQCSEERFWGAYFALLALEVRRAALAAIEDPDQRALTRVVLRQPAPGAAGSASGAADGGSRGWSFTAVGELMRFFANGGGWTFSASEREGLDVGPMPAAAEDEAAANCPRGLPPALEVIRPALGVARTRPAPLSLTGISPTVASTVVGGGGCDVPAAGPNRCAAMIVGRPLYAAPLRAADAGGAAPGADVECVLRSREECDDIRRQWRDTVNDLYQV